MKGLPLLIVAVVAGGFGFLFGRVGSAPPAEEHGHEEATEEHGEEGGIHFSPAALRLAGLEIREAKAAPLPAGRPLMGEVVPNLSGVARVSSPVAGKIGRVFVDVGDTVKAGQPLATVASSELAAAQAAWRQAVDRRAVAQRNLVLKRRMAKLGEFGPAPLEEARTKEIEARQLAEEAEHHRETTEATVSEAAREVEARIAAVHQDESELDVARKALARSRVLFTEQIVSKQDLERAEATVRQQEAALVAAQANVEKARAAERSARVVASAAQAEFDLATRKAAVIRQGLERERKIASGGLRTNREVSESEAAVRQAELEVRSASEAVGLLGGRPGGANVVTVVAPMAGKVTERLVTLGESVDPTRSLFAILDPGTVWVDLAAFPADVLAVRVGQSISIRSDARTLRATVVGISETLDEKTRTVRIRCAVEGAPAWLRPGGFVRGFLPSSSRGGTSRLTVEEDAIQEMAGKRVVFVEGSTGEFQAVPVELGEEMAGRVEVLSGLRAGDRYVSRNALIVKAQAMKGELGHDH